ncbi:hypothetical protein OCU04_006003 [Sclerotinia nivalis]|uniref:Uncharacterized protein n=1 Tax=Sclerotinia nivalis TaxID=352851 RepID=A0A9X0DKU1_9HELO|nr:hypothetical protein OCU04_006003 [Sclerotinia nivalis]
MEQAGFDMGNRLARNILPLKMLRNVNSFVFKAAQIHEIPDYFFPPGVEEAANLSVPDLPSPELIDEYSKLTSGVAPVTECVGLLWDRLEEHALYFEHATLSVSNKTYAGHQCSIRVIEDDPPLIADEPNFRRAQAISKASIHPSLDHTESTNDVSRFKEYRGNLLGILELQYQQIRSCSIKFREYLKDENGPSGVFMIGPFRATDPTEHWNRVARGVKILEEYEYSFVRELTEELQLAIRKENKFMVLDYNNPHMTWVMERVAWAYEMIMWRKLIVFYREAIMLLEEQYFKLRRCRMALFKWDVLGKDFDLAIQPDLLKRIRWLKQSLKAAVRDGKYLMGYCEGDTSDEDSDEDSDDDEDTDDDEDIDQISQDIVI